MLLPTRRNARSRLGLAAVALAAIALTALGAPQGASAQGQPLTVNVVGFSADDWPAPQAIITVQGEQGQPLVDLEPSAFQAYLNDQPAPVTSVTRAVDGSVPIAVVLALDVSGSMEGAALDQAKAAAGVFLDSLGPLDTVAVLTFGDSVTLAQPFTLDRNVARYVIGGLTAGGKTALYDATSESARLAAGSASSRRAVVLLSDGLDNGSQLSREEALAAGKTLGAPVFAIGLGNTDRAYLGELADTTGGQFAETPSPEGLTLLYQQVAERLRGQYVVTLNSSALDAPRADAATLRVDVSSGDLAGNGERLICPQRVCVMIPALADGDRIEATRTVSAQVVAEDPVTSVDFLLDGQSLATVTEPPYEFTLDPASLAGGEHAFAVKVTTAAGGTDAREISLQLGAAAAGGSGMNMVLIAVVAMVIVVMALFAWFVLRRRNRGDQPEPPPVAFPQPPLAPTSEVPILERLEKERLLHPMPAREEARGRLLAVGGPIQGETFALGGNPVSLGSGTRCRIRLEENVDGAEIPSEYARVWIREGKLMVHELRRLTAMGSVGGRWEVLGSGEMFSLGPYTFHFEVIGEEAGPSGVNGAAEPAAMAPASPGAAPRAPAILPQSAPSDVPRMRPVSVDSAGEPAAAPSVEAEVPNVLRTEPRAVEANETPPPVPSEQPQVPNVLRSRPAADGPFAPDTASANDEPPAVPNVLRDTPLPREEASHELAGQPEPEIPNVLRDHPERDDPDANNGRPATF